MFNGGAELGWYNTGVVDGTVLTMADNAKAYDGRLKSVGSS